MDNCSQVEPLLIVKVSGSQCRLKHVNIRVCFPWTHHHNENLMLTLYLKFQWNIKSSQNVINKVALKYGILKYNRVSCF